MAKQFCEDPREDITDVLNAIGTYKEQAATTTTLPYNATTSLCSITIDKGVWIVRGYINFTTSTDGRRGIGVGNSSTTDANQRASDYGYTRMTTVKIINNDISDTYTINLYGFQASGSDMTIEGLLSAVKIK